MVELREYELPDEFLEIMKVLKPDTVNRLNIQHDSFIRIRDFGLNYLKLNKQARKLFDSPETIEFEWCDEVLKDAILPELGKDTCTVGFDCMTNFICYRISVLIRNKTIPEIRQLMNIPGDFTPDEEAALSKQLQWASTP